MWGVTRFTAVAALAAVAAAGLVSGQASAGEGSGGRTTAKAGVSAREAFEERVKVTKVKDGDTVMVAGQTAGIRLIGVDAPDMGTGDCYYQQSKNALKKLVQANRLITLRASRKGSFSLNEGVRRPLRYLDRGALDMNLYMLSNGFAVYNNATTEHSREQAYHRTAQSVASQHRGVWNPSLCGTGPTASLRMFVNYNADGLDTSNIGGKWVRIVNDGAPINLGGWRLRTGNRGYFDLPPVTLATGQSLVVHNGAGSPYSNGDQHVYWGRKIDLPDPRTSINKVGSVYLQDPERNFRFWSLWPCTIDCTTTPVLGKLRIKANYKPDDYRTVNGVYDESVDVTNVSDAPVDASFLVVEAGASAFEIPSGNVLQPGQKIKIWVNSHGDEYSFKRSGPILSDRSGFVLLRGNDGITVDRYSW